MLVLAYHSRMLQGEKIQTLRAYIAWSTRRSLSAWSENASSKGEEKKCVKTIKSEIDSDLLVPSRGYAVETSFEHCPRKTLTADGSADGDLSSSSTAKAKGAASISSTPKSFSNTRYAPL